MRVLLIGASTDEHADDSIDKTYLKKQFVSPPLGLHRMAQHLPFDVDVIDPNISPTRPYLDRHARDYDVIGCSLTHPTLENDLGLLWYARCTNPHATLLAGGEEAFFNNAQVLKHSPADACIQGEGEEPLRAICGGTPLGRVPGAITRDGLGPFNPALQPDAFVSATVGMDFSAIPYPEYWDYMAAFYPHASEETRRKTNTVRLFVSNHCPLKCTFCASTNFLTQDGTAPAKIAWVSAAQLLEMITNVVAAHPETRTIFFHDDHFTIGKAGRDRAVELSRLVVNAKRAGILPERLGFMAQCKITDVTRDMLTAMKAAGFWMLSYGVESFAQPILDEFGKNCTVAEIGCGLLDNLAAGVQPFANMILTSAGCSLEDVWHTAVACALLVQSGAEVGMNPYCMAFPGASMLNDPDVSALVSYKRVRVPGTDIAFDKTDRIIPRDAQVQELMDLMGAGVDARYDGTKVTSGRRSNIILAALFDAFVQLDYRPFEAIQLGAMVDRYT